MQGLVTVFGGTGFIGTQVVRALAKRGLRVRAAARNPGRGYRLRMLGDVGQIQVAQANLRNPASLERALEGAEACVNLVGIFYESGRQSFQGAHVEGARAVAEACARQGVRRLVQMSAIGADANSASAYAWTKAAGEAAVREAFPAATVFRPSIVFGPEDGFFNKFAAMAAVSPALPLIGGGETRFQPVYVADVAAAIARGAADPALAGKTFELGGPAVYSFRELMEYVLKTTFRRRALVPVPWPVAGLLGRAGDVQAWARGVIGLVPPPPITSDQVALLKTDNVVDPAFPGLAELGIQPTALETVVPSYLVRYRRGGEFAGGLAPNQ